jgi:DNA repair exonuclease SbcCD ATPase subunit
VNLLRCHLLGFGKLSNLMLSFGRGLNVVFAPNEGGKTTLQRFLIGMLYGPIRHDIKVQRRFDAWLEQYRPWNAADYAGTLWCLLENGRELEIHRTFDREDGRFEVRTATGEDITRQYEIHRNGDVNFTASHLGLTKDLYESIGVIRETEMAQLRNPETLRDRIANIAQTGDEKLSVRLSLVKLEEALESVGSDRAPTRPYKLALDRLQGLREERSELEARHRECAAWVREKHALGNEIEQLEKKLKTAGRTLMAARRQEVRLRIRTLEDIDKEICHLNAEVDSLGADADFPIDRLDELTRLAADQENAERQLEEIRSRNRDAAGRKEQLESEICKLSGYSALHTTIEPEKITEWFVNYLSLSRQREDAQRTINRFTEESARLQSNLESLSPALKDAETDWERKARLTSEQERAASEKSLAVADKVKQEKAVHAGFKDEARRQGFFAAASFAAAAAGIATSASGILPPLIGWGGGVALGILGIWFLMAAGRSRRSARASKQYVADLEADLRQMRSQAQAIASELHQAISSSGFATIEEFLAAAKQALLDRQRLGDLTSHIRDAEQQRNHVQLEADGVYAHLRECMARVGLSCAPGNVKAQVDILRANLRRYAELAAGQRGLSLEIEALQMDENSLASRSTLIASKIRDILAEAKVESADGFCQAAQNYRRFLELRTKIESRMRELERSRGALTLDQWRERLLELEGAGEAGEAVPEEGEPLQPSSYLPYMPTVEIAEQDEKNIAGILASKREDYARGTERVRQAFHNYRSLSDIEEDLATCETEVEELTLNRKALTLALDGIRSLARLQQEVCAPQLNRIVEERFLKICPDRYQEVKIDPDFRIQVRETTTAELRAAEFLSRGTQDQLYFSVRFGILELLGNAQESSPCLLDEPFVAYDHDRMCAAFSILEKEAPQRQLILFTCREDVKAQALRHGATLINLCPETQG